jgi:hypothetical protein
LRTRIWGLAVTKVKPRERRRSSGFHLQLPQGPLLHQQVPAADQEGPLGLLLRQEPLLGGEPGDPVLRHAQVPVDQLQVHDLQVPDRVHAPLGVLHRGVLEGPEHVDQGLRLGGEGEEGVSQTSALARVPGEARQIHELDLGGGDLLGLPELGQPVEALVRHGDDGPVRVRLPPRVGLDLRPGPGDDVEDRGLAAQGQTHDTAVKHRPRSFP